MVSRNEQALGALLSGVTEGSPHFIATQRRVEGILRELEKYGSRRLEPDFRFSFGSVLRDGRIEHPLHWVTYNADLKNNDNYNSHLLALVEQQHVQLLTGNVLPRSALLVEDGARLLQNFAATREQIDRKSFGYVFACASAHIVSVFELIDIMPEDFFTEKVHDVLKDFTRMGQSDAKETLEYLNEEIAKSKARLDQEHDTIRAYQILADFSREHLENQDQEFLEPALTKMKKDYHSPENPARFQIQSGLIIEAMIKRGTSHAIPHPKIVIKPLNPIKPQTFFDLDAFWKTVGVNLKRIKLKKRTSEMVHEHGRALTDGISALHTRGLQVIYDYFRSLLSLH